MARRFCVNGHDTEVVGRRPGNRQCRECFRMVTQRYNVSPAGRVRRVRYQAGALGEVTRALYRLKKRMTRKAEYIEALEGGAL